MVAVELLAVGLELPAVVDVEMSVPAARALYEQKKGDC